jgi:hypothetical protein
MASLYIRIGEGWPQPQPQLASFRGSESRILFSPKSLPSGLLTKKQRFQC